MKKNGSRGGSRTPDRVVNSHLLYQLSYPGTMGHIMTKCFIVVKHVYERMANSKKGATRMREIASELTLLAMTRNGGTSK